MKGKRLIASLLCALMLIALPQAAVFAEDAQDEEIIDVYFDDSETAPVEDPSPDEEYYDGEAADEEYYNDSELSDEDALIPAEDESFEEENTSGEDIPAAPDAEEAENEFETSSGTCGENLSWYFSDSGVLTISGSGSMYDYSSTEHAPWYSYEISSVKIENGVNSIGSYAFYRNSFIKSASIPASVGTIGKYAFYKCSSLEGISLPEGVAVIGNYAFNGCRSLLNISLPVSLASIGSLALDDCGFEQINYAGTLAQWEALGYDLSVRIVCSDGSSLAVASGTCGTGVNWSLSDDGVLKISGAGKMDNYTELSEWIGGRDNGIYTWYSTAPWFWKHSQIKNIVIEEGVTSIGSFAFYECYPSGVTLPKSLTQIGNYAFWGLTTLYYVGTISDWCAIDFGKSSDQGTYPNSFAQHIYFQGSPVTEITIPEGTSVINKSLFQNFTDAVSLSIPGSVTQIGGSAFSGCTALESLVLPEGTASIGVNAFSGCTGLKSVSISSSVRKIDANAFSGCTNLSEVYIPKTVTGIGQKAFDVSRTAVFYEGSRENWLKICSKSNIDPDVIHYNGTGHIYENSVCTVCFKPGEGSGQAAAYGKCGDNSYWVLSPEGVLTVSGTGSITLNFARTLGSLTVKSAIIGNGISSIETGVFNSCKNLANVSIPGSVETIGSSAFSGCTSLQSISLPGSVQSIGGSAFSGCTGLESVSLPAGLQSIGISAFQSCKSLTGIVIPEGVQSIGESAFEECTGLAGISLPDSITAINPGTFYNCTGLAAITVPDSVVSIESRAFYNCGIREIIFPDSLKRIAASAFSGCSNLANIKFLGDAPAIGSNSFTGVKAIAYYPVNNGTWTGSVMQSYSGSITWKPYGDHPAPAITTVANHADYMIVCWNKVEGAVSYKLAYREGSSAWQIINVPLSMADSRGNPRVNLKNLKQGANYSFIAYASFSDGTETKSLAATQTRLLSPAVKARAGSGYVSLTWNGVEGGSRYKIYYREKGGSWQLYAWVGKDVTSVNIKASVINANGLLPLVKGHTYEFAVILGTSVPGITSGFPTSLTAIVY